MQLFWTQFNTEMLTFTLLNNISISKFILMTAYYIFSSQSKTGEIYSHIGSAQPISASKTPISPTSTIMIHRIFCIYLHVIFLQMEEKNVHNKKTRHPLRTPRRFRLSFINENTFNEVWTLKFTGPKIIAAVAFLLFAIACMVATIIVLTPIRTLLPGYLKKEQRQENIVNAMRVDSLSEIVKTNNAYMKNLTEILNPSSAPAKQSIPKAEIAALPPDSLLPPSENEKMFVHRFEEAERFNLKVKSPAAADGIAFFCPINGATVKTSGNNATEITLIAPKEAAIFSIYGGTVIGTYTTLNRGTTAIVQHPNGFISKYSGIATPFAVTGDKVEAGSVIGLAGSGEKPEETLISIELWNNGTPLNPRDYIPF